MEYNGPLFDVEHTKQKVEGFITGAKISITVISAKVDKFFTEMFNNTDGIEVEIIHPKDKRFPPVTYIIVDGKKVMAVSGQSLDMKPEYRFIIEEGMEEMKRVLQLFSDLEEIFSIKV